MFIQSLNFDYMKPMDARMPAEEVRPDPKKYFERGVADLGDENIEYTEDGDELATSDPMQGFQVKEDWEEDAENKMKDYTLDRLGEQYKPKEETWVDIIDEEADLEDLAM